MSDPVPFIPPFDLQEDLLSLWSAGQAHDTAITILMGALVAVACGWLGCWLILQGLALIGDAISHTVLLGIVVAFLITGDVSGIGMFVAATITGVVTVLLIDSLHASSRLKEDAAIGIVFTALFALGIVLLGTFASGAHIDRGHVLDGNLEFVTDGESVTLLGIEVPIAVCQMGVVAALLLALIVAFYKELLLVAFDPLLAASLGLRPALFRYGMLAVLSLTVVGSFRAVGPILVVAMLIAPAATAFLLTSRLPMMFVISAIVGVVAAIVGYHLSYWLSVSVASAMVCVACGLFGVAFLFAPRQGVLAAVWRRARNRRRAGQENIIRRLWKLSGGVPATAVAVNDVAAALASPRWKLNWSVRALLRRGWVEVAQAAPLALRLTPRGSLQAQRLDRAHRLWETFLVDKVGLASDHVHQAAEEVEHVLTDQLVERLDDVLGHPEIDPHGAPIPRSPVSDQAADVFTLSKLRTGDCGRIAGLAEAADEHPSAAKREQRLGEVARLGLALGQSVTILGRDASGEEWLLRRAGGTTIGVPHVIADTILIRLDNAPVESAEPHTP
ncbi:MAG TPA: metal ABC transporter permease [Planctomycetaceae bacterium]|nr:metal ABC transporter permease [Planctomycetaceae bacterium]